MPGDSRIPSFVVFAGVVCVAACDASDAGPHLPVRAPNSPDARQVMHPPPPFTFDGAPTFRPTFPSEPTCDYLKIRAADYEGTLGGPVEFLGFLDGDIVGRSGDGENFVIHMPDRGLIRLPPDARDLGIRSVVSEWVLGCSRSECALLEQDPTTPGFLRRMRGGTVPSGTAWGDLFFESYRLCVRNPRGAVLCFDRVQWETPDGGVVTNAGDAGSNRDASTDGNVDANDRGRDARADDAAHTPDAAASSIERAPCGTPIYCASPELAGDPLCYYGRGDGYVWGVTVAGRMIKGTIDDAGLARCTASPPFGSPVGLASASCGIVSHVVLLTADGMYETCGCAQD